MKKLILVVASIVAVALSAQAVTTPGQVNFNNKVTSSIGNVNSPVFDVGGVTKLDGAGFVAQLYAGATANSLVAIGDAAPFRTGAGAGYWNAVPSARDIATVEAGSKAFVKVVAWEKTANNYATYEAAKAGGAKAGESKVFEVTTGGVGAPPSLPAVLTGLESFSLVPEPSTIALGLLGVAGLLIYRRK